MIALRPLAVLLAMTALPPRVPRAADSGIPVRFREGAVHGFLELRTAAGVLLAPGDLIQADRAQGMESRMVFHFSDASVFVETVTFSQQGVFRLLRYHLVQSGPAFAEDLDATLTRGGQYVVKTKSHRNGEVKRYTGTIDLPPDVYNGLIIIVAKNLTARDTETVHIVAFTPRPRLIGLSLIPSGSRRAANGRHSAAATDFTLKPRLGTLLGLVAGLLGKTPPDSHTWIMTDGAPAFVRYEGPLYAGPVWRIDQAAPVLMP